MIKKKTKTAAGRNKLSKKKNISMADIRLRKTRLQDDLDLLEKSFENRFKKAKKSVIGSIKPADYIKKRPLQSLGVAVIIGFAIGISRQKSKKSGGQDSTANRGIGFTGILFNEMKRIAARRAASYMTDLIDQKLSSK